MDRPVGNEATPQLPPRDPHAVSDEQAQLDLATGDSSAAAMRRVEWQPYDEPELLPLVGAKRALIAARTIVGAWAVALLVVAVVVRRNAPTDMAGNGVRAVGAVGIVAAVGAAVTGWYWSDRLTQNVHRLGSRLPPRRRCVSAWASPMVWAGVLGATVLQLAPTELIDVRPVIAITIFTAAVARPYALCRRLVKSLSRVDSDVLIGTAFVLDLAGFGLVWWQLWTWPGQLTQADLGAADTLIGLGGAAMVALATNVIVWHLLLRDVDAKVVHRTIALRTRDEHRQLRLRGIDPMDPEVRWALLRTRQEEYAAERRVAEQESSVAERTTAHAGPANLSTDERRADDTAAPSTGDAEAAADAVADRIRDRLRLAAEAPPKSAPDADLEDPEVDVVAPSPPPDRRLDVVARLASRAAASRRPTDDSTRRQAKPVGSHDRRAVEPPARDRLERIARRLGESEHRDSDETVLDRLARYGISPPAEAEPIPDRSLDGPVDPGELVGPGLTVQRLYLLELVRYLVLLSLAAIAAAAAWLITRTVTIELVDGTIPAPDVKRLELARRLTVGALAISLALASLWAAAVGRWSRRSGAEDTSAGRDLALFGVAATANVVMIVATSDRPGTSSLAMLVCLTTATWSISGIVRVQDWFRRRSTLTTAWLWMLAILSLTSWVGRFLQPIEARDEVELITFTGAAVSITAAVAVVLAGLATADIEEAIRFSHPPEDESEPDVRTMLPFGSHISGPS
ncbi:MAG: hypothetical protein R8G01_09070 [Ilumatobacteraceae bacterium]|nr:hypothetical protein [Ilumatobacteraceae bacterium]